MEIKEQLFEKLKDNADYKVWTFIAKWINFERWFSYEKEPDVEKILAEGETISDPRKFILDELSRYE